MKLFFVAALFKIEVAGNLGRGIRLWRDVFLTNDSRYVDSLLTEQFRAAVGQIECQALRDAGAVIYSIYEEEGELAPGPNAVAHVNAMLGVMNVFLTCFWLVRDNNVNTELGFLEYPYKSPRANVSSNSWASYFSDARATFGVSSFTADEIRQVRDYFHLFNVDDVGAAISQRDSKTTSDTGRLDRVFYFLQAARSANDLGIRISLYITCFEAILSTDNLELSHKLSERVAVFLGGDAARKIETYRMMKAAYSVRSKVVHGDRLSAKLVSDLPSLSVSCDVALRQVLVAVLSSPRLRTLFGGKGEGIEDHMLSALFDQSLIIRDEQ